MGRGGHEENGLRLSVPQLDPTTHGDGSRASMGDQLGALLALGAVWDADMAMASSLHPYQPAPSDGSVMYIRVCVPYAVSSYRRCYRPLHVSWCTAAPLSGADGCALP